MSRKTEQDVVSLEQFIEKKHKSRDAQLDDRDAFITHHLHRQKEEKYRHPSLAYASQILADVQGAMPEDIESKECPKSFVPIDAPYKAKRNAKFTFIDLFAGVGGFRLAMQQAGGECVFSSEFESNAKFTYAKNYGEVPFGDITKDAVKEAIPDNFDLLCGGFPCQAFSVAGYRKGFSDTRGTLFFDIEKIIETHRPKAVFLENVKNLYTHDQGNTFRVIKEILAKKLGYIVKEKVLNSMTHANVPQNRERIFIVAFDPDHVPDFDSFRFPDEIKLTRRIHDVLETGKQADKYYYAESHPYYPELLKTMTSRDTLYQWRRVYVRENKSNVCPTLTANMGAGGHNVPLVRDEFGIRKLTPRECFSFQGYPKEFVLSPLLADSRLYMQAGNSVTVPLIRRIGDEIERILRSSQR